MTAAPHVLWLDEASAPGNAALGGKFANLADMTASGFAVPRGFGITTGAYRHFMAAAGLVDEARRIRMAAATMALSSIKGETAALIAAIKTAPLPDDLEQAIATNYALMERRAGSVDVPVAVRSSGESEDLAGASFAGQYDTFLWICGIEAVLTHVRSCWAGLFGEAVLSYRRDGDVVIAKSDFGVCVGIQQMVAARCAGVMFTLDPVTGDRSKIVVEACWGLGEGVVKGDVTPCQFTLDKVTFEITARRTAAQAEEYRFDPGTGTVGLCPVERERQATVCLADAPLLQLAALGKRIEAVRGAPQDIEWALDDKGEIAILQVRPETVWSRRTAAALVSAAPKSPVAHVLARLSGTRLTRAPGGAREP